MKVILNKDLSPLGEEGDVREVARGYARNFLFPRNIAVLYNPHTVKLFESRQGEIDARKLEKRKDAAGIKEKLESLNIEITMPAGANGRLYGAVTSQTVAEELAKQGHQIERKRIELAGTSFKNVGKYKAQIRLYENTSAEITVTVLGQEIKTETRTPTRSSSPRRRRDAGAGADSGAANTASDTVQAQNETAQPEAEANALADTPLEKASVEVSAVEEADESASAIASASASASSVEVSGEE